MIVEFTVSNNYMYLVLRVHIAKGKFAVYDQLRVMTKIQKESLKQITFKLPVL